MDPMPNSSLDMVYALQTRNIVPRHGFGEKCSRGRLEELPVCEVGIRQFMFGTQGGRELEMIGPQCRVWDRCLGRVWHGVDPFSFMQISRALNL